MDLVNIRDIFRNKKTYENTQVTIGGWVRSNRASKNFGFLVINDGTFFEPIQVVYADTLANFAEIGKVNVGAALIVKGQLVPTPQAKQPFEIQAEEVIVEGASTPDYPLQKKRHTFEYLRTISHLRARTNTFEAVFRVRSLCAYAIHKFFQERDFVYVHTPIITGSDCEGAGEMFQGNLICNITLFAVLIYEIVGPLLTKEALTAAGDIQPMPEHIKNRRQMKLEHAKKRKKEV